MLNKRDETNERKWEMQFFELKKFKEKYGHCDVPQKGPTEYRKLARWCGEQRKIKKRYPLKQHPDRIGQLNEIGFTWDVLDKWFEEKYRMLEKYFNEHGHCEVTPLENKVLNKWCSHIRGDTAGGKRRLTPEMKMKLEKLNFRWHSTLEELNHKKWVKKLNELKAFITRHGRYPMESETGYKHLAWWVEKQKSRIKKGKMPPEELKTLKNEGIELSALEFNWEKKYAELIAYKNKFGHCDVGNGRKDRAYKKLAFWSRMQRDSYMERKLSPARTKKLNEIGFSWLPLSKLGDHKKVSDNELLNELKRLLNLTGVIPGYYEIDKYGKYGHTTYSARFGSIALARKKAGIPDTHASFMTHRRKLIANRKWEAQFAQLKKFKSEFGHCNVPQRGDEEYSKLARWCQMQRKLKKDAPGKIDAIRIKKLTGIGFCWSILDMLFEEKYLQLKKYHDTHGHCNVRQSENKALAKWRSHLREDKAKGLNRLSEERIKRLNQLGFKWGK
jgi:hypothetical protein